MTGKLRQPTFSLCPVCGKRLPAWRTGEDGRVWLRKECPEHGSFQALIWSGHSDYSRWIGDSGRGLSTEPPCPDNCGICPDHQQETCCTVLEVTRRCNLECRICFAGGGTGDEPPLHELKESIRTLVRPGQTLLQLSGGEPALRDDLPEVISFARQTGCAFVQLNTNGIRLAGDPSLVKNLAEAGLSFVFLQFDGCDDSVYRSLRGRPLLEIKERAIENCSRNNLGVTLVPTIVPGINTGQIGDIIRFAVSRSPAVRGIHFQPLGQLGKSPQEPNDGLRFTLDNLLSAMEEQSPGLIRADDFNPSRCNHPLCGLHADFMVSGENRLLPLTRHTPSEKKECCGEITTASRNRAFISRRWQRPPEPSLSGCCGSPGSLEEFLERVKSHGFTITAMAFQDRHNLDFDRLRRCSLHVYEQGRFIPFCAYYLKREKS